MTHVVELVGEIAEGIADGDVGLLDAGVVCEVGEQGDYHLRGGVHVIKASEVVIFDVFYGPAGPNLDATDEIYLDDDFFSGFIADIAFAMRFIEVPDEAVPCGGGVFLAGEGLYCAGHHPVHGGLAGVGRLPPVPVSRAGPIGGIGVVDPDDAAGVNAFGDSYGCVCGQVGS